MTATKGGKPLSLRAAINKAFRERRLRHDAEKKFKREQKRLDKANPSSRTPDQEFTKIMIEAQRKLQESNPEGYAGLCAKRDAEFKRTQKAWRAEKRWDYRIPVDIAKRVKDTTFDGWYPVADKYSHMCTFPNGIKPDWLDGVIEICRLIILHPPRVQAGYQDKGGKYAAKQSKETVRCATNALSRALGLKHQREQAAKRKQKKGAGA